MQERRRSQIIYEHHHWAYKRGEHFLGTGKRCHSQHQTTWVEQQSHINIVQLLLKSSIGLQIWLRDNLGSTQHLVYKCVTSSVFTTTTTNARCCSMVQLTLLLVWKLRVKGNNRRGKCYWDIEQVSDKEHTRSWLLGMVLSRPRHADTLASGLENTL
jgi:hypothetical protein